MLSNSAFFSTETLQFFTDLKANNNREWFADNKKSYETYVKKPLQDFITECISQIAQIDKQFPMQEAKDCIFRIYRDVRFSNNKDPLKDFSGAYLTRFGKKTEYPGLYFHLSDVGSFYGGGAYMPSNENLRALRDEINYRLDEFIALKEDPEFKQRFEFEEAEKNKILPAHLRPNAEIFPMMYSKSFFYTDNLSTEILLSPNLLSHVITGYVIQMPMMQFMGKVLGANPVKKML